MERYKVIIKVRGHGTESRDGTISARTSVDDYILTCYVEDISDVHLVPELMTREAQELIDKLLSR